MSAAAEEAPAARPPKRRRPWLAALLSLLWPGLGQLYNGEARRALKWFALVLAFYVYAWVLLTAVDAALPFLAGALLLMVMGPVLAISCAVDAFRRARRIGSASLARFQRLWVYLAVVIAITALQDVLVWPSRSHGGCAPGTPREFAHTYWVPSGSMQPTVEPGEMFLAETSYFCRNDPRHGELAAFLRPTANSPIYIKRIIGLPGDRVRLTEGRVYINGEPVAQEWLESGISTDEMGQELRRARYVESFSDGARYVVEISNLGAEYENTPEVTVPADSYFVLGDTRDNSFDSRMRDFGFIPRALIVDRPAYIIWSSDWDRIGLRLR